MSKFEFLEIKTVGGTIFRGWCRESSISKGLVHVYFHGERAVRIPLSQLEYAETLTEGDPRIPAWAVEKLAALKAE